MSEVESYTGRLEPIDIEIDIESTAEEICKENEWELGKYHDSFLELLRDDGYEKYHIRGDKIYKVEREDVTDEDTFDARTDEWGNVEFRVCYYNGGCSFGEALDIALNKEEENK